MFRTTDNKKAKTERDALQQKIIKPDANFILFSPPAEHRAESRMIQKALNELRDFGLTREIFDNGWDRTVPFSVDHKDLLFYLVTGVPSQNAEPLPPVLGSAKKLTVTAALQEIKKLDSNQINLLQNWYTFGLRGDHLRSWVPGPENKFLPGHEAAAEYLIKRALTEDSQLKQALQPMNGLTEKEAWDMYRKDYIVRQHI